MTLLILASLGACQARAAYAGSELAMSDPKDSSSSYSESTETENQNSSSEKTTTVTTKEKVRQARLHYDKGLQYKRGGDSGRALIEFLKSTREDPKQLDAYYEQALIFREKGMHKLAVSRLEQVLAIRPKFQKARLLLATIKLEQGKVSDAFEQLGTTLGLPKSEATAFKPDADEESTSAPPMILQSLHTALPLPAISKAKKIEQPALKAEGDTQESANAEPKRPARKSKPTSRRKIRELMARKYHSSRDKKRRSQKHWIARLFSWPEPFNNSQKHVETSADFVEDDDLKPEYDTENPIQNSGIRTARGDTSTHQSRLADSSETPVTESLSGVRKDGTTTKNLIAYNGRPEDTFNIVKEANNDSREEVKPKKLAPGWNEETWNPLMAVPALKKSAPSTVAPPPPRKSESSEDSDKKKVAFKGGGLEFIPPATQENKFEEPVRAKPKPRQTEVVEDEWTKRLRYLNEHGTSTLKQGEAFMFSEDTGEAVLFLTDGQRIRRVIAPPMDTQEVIKQRRPDVLVPKELFYNTSLLGKVVNSMPPPPPPAPPPQTQPGITPPLLINPPASTPSDVPTPPSFKIEQMMDNPTGFWNWFKGLVNL